MLRIRFSPLVILVLFQLILGIALLPPSLAQEWAFRRPRGTVRVVDLYLPSVSVMLNYAEGLVTLDKDNNWVPCLAEDWRWMDDRTIEFKLRQGVTFHNGERFNAEMGFVPRRDIRNARGSAAWTPRPGWRGVRQLTIGGGVDYYENHSGLME